MKNATILLVNTPVTSPAKPSWNPAFLAGSFLGSSLNCLQYDANLDFFLNYAFSKKQAHVHWSAIRKKAASGIIPETDFKRIENAWKRITNTTVSINSLRTPEFYEPETFLAVRHHIDDLLLCTSAAFFPHKIGWGTCTLKSDFLNEDPDMNPFFLLCKQGLEHQILQSDPNLVVLFISSRDQIMAGKIMAEYIKTNFSEKTVVMIKDSHLVFEDENFFDHCFTVDCLDPFFKLVFATYKIEINFNGPIEPDFDGLPLMDYLTPDRILPVNPSLFKDKKTFWTFISNIRDKADARGFVLKDHSFKVETLVEAESSDLFFCVSKFLEDADIPEAPASKPAHCPASVKLIVWDTRPGQTRLMTKALWDLSKQGIWNHVIISKETRRTLKNALFSFVSSNPNIAHSFENHDHHETPGQPGKSWIDERFQPYSNVERLPGTPFWKTLEDPVYLMLYLNQYDKKELFCNRSDNRDDPVIKLGSDIQFYFQKPDELPVGFLDEICRMVEAGGSVDVKYVRHNLERAYLIGYAVENGVIVGNSSLKHPRKEFIERINKITGLDFTHFIERGYTSVRPEYRALGVGARLLEGLTSRALDHKIFSIISEDNIATKKIAQRNKTRQIATYYSEKMGKDLGIWMPEQMIDKNWNIPS